MDPLLISTRIAAFVIAVLAALWISAWLASYTRVDAAATRHIGLGAIVVGLVAARAAHVALHWDAYALEPWKALQLWQPGYLPVVGLAGGALYVLWRLRCQTASRRLALVRALSTGFAVGATILAAVLGTMNWTSDAGGLGAGDRVPDFQLVNLAGERVSQSDLRGKGIVLDFWATWCPPCRREMPLLESTWQSHRSRDVTIVGIAVGESADRVRPFVGSMGVTYPVWTNAGSNDQDFDDTNEILRRFGGVGLPTTVFVNADGQIEDIHVGEVKRAMLQKQLAEIAPH